MLPKAYCTQVFVQKFGSLGFRILFLFACKNKKLNPIKIMIKYSFEFFNWIIQWKSYKYLMSMMHHLIICACGKVYKQILLKIFQNINQDNLHYSHILLPLHFFNYITRRARWEWPNIARFAMLDCLASKVLNACF